MAKKKTAKKVAKKAAAKPVAKKTAKKAAPKPAAKKTVKKAKPAATKKPVKKKTAAKVAAPKKVAKKAAAKTVAKKATTKVAKKVAAKKPAPAPKKAASKPVAKKAATKVEKPQKAPKAEKKVVAKKAVAKKEEKKTGKKGKSEKIEKEETIGTQSKKKSQLDDFGDDDFEFGEDSEDIVIDEDVELAPTHKEEDQIKDNLAEELMALSEDFSLKDIFESVRMLEFFNIETDECIEKSCDNPATTLGFCRYHYIRNWKDIKKKQSILEEGRLQNYIEELVAKFPIKYIEAIITDLSEDKSFVGVLKELNIESEEDGEIFDEVGDDDQDIAYETKTTSKGSYLDD